MFHHQNLQPEETTSQSRDTEHTTHGQSKTTFTLRSTLLSLMTGSLLLFYSTALPVHVLWDIHDRQIQMSQEFQGKIADFSKEKLGRSPEDHPPLKNILEKLKLTRACQVPSAVRYFNQDSLCKEYQQLTTHESYAGLAMIYGLITVGLLSVLVSGIRNLRRIRRQAALTFYFLGMGMGGVMVFLSTAVWLSYLILYKHGTWIYGPVFTVISASILSIGAFVLAYSIHRRIRALARSVQHSHQTEIKTRHLRLVHGRSDDRKVA